MAKIIKYEDDTFRVTLDKDEAQILLTLIGAHDWYSSNDEETPGLLTGDFHNEVHEATGGSNFYVDDDGDIQRDKDEEDEDEDE